MPSSDTIHPDKPRPWFTTEHCAWQLCLAAGYVLLGLASNYYTACTGAVSIFWPSSGLVLGALLIGGQRFIWGALLGMLILNSMLHASLIAALGITLGSGASAWLGFYLLTQRELKNTFLHSLSGYLHLFLLGGAVASIVAAIMGALTLQLTGAIRSTAYWYTVADWWMGDMLGVVLFTPFMLALHDKKAVKPLPWRKQLTYLSLLALTTAVGLTVFLGWLNDYLGDIAMGYWMFLLVSWIAIQLGTRSTTLILIIIALQAMVGANLNMGHFAHDIVQTHLHNYWRYMMILSLVSMAMTIYVTQIKNNLTELELKDAALNATANTVVITDHNGIIQWANQAFTAVTGYSLSEACGHNPRELVKSGKQNQQFYEAMWNTLLDHRPWQGDLINRRKDGTLYVENMTITPLANEHHQITHFVAIKQDISERKRLEQSLMVSDLALKSISQGVLISDENQFIQSVNQAFTDITGYTPDDMRGKKCSIVQGKLTDPQTVARIRLAIGHQNTFTGEILNYRKDGTTFWNELTISPVLDQQGVLTNFIGITRDITERKALESARQAALDLLQKIASRVPGLIYQFRLYPDGRACLPFASDAIFSLYHVTPESVQEDANLLFTHVHPDDLEPVWQSIQQSAENLTLWHQEHRVQFEDGSVRWLLGNALPEREVDGCTLWHGFITDITEHKQMEEQVYRLAFYDALTQLPNRRLLDDRLNQAIETSKRNASYGAVLFIDLDNFKPLNDTHGHVVGDLLLIEAANRLKSCVRQMDTVARFGGDEFVVILTNLDHGKRPALAEAEAVAEKIHAALSHPYTLHIRRAGENNATIEHHCSASIGVAMFSHPGVQKENILKWADTAMYQAKITGRNSICFYESPPISL
ncbi:MAG: PAS domain S-box protein [Gallionella sp.]|nr:PAS domain S-box protein [Gallionella sp.]